MQALRFQCTAAIHKWSAVQTSEQELQKINEKVNSLCVLVCAAGLCCRSVLPIILYLCVILEFSN